MPLIKQDFIDRLLQDADIVQVFQYFGEDVHKKGATYFCHSPWADEKTPSCAVYPKTQTFKDYSSGKQGDVLKYIIEKKSLTYPEAIQELAKMQGKIVEYEDSETSKHMEEKRQKEEDLRKYLEGLQKKFREELQKLPQDHAAWQEIAKRGYTAEDVKDWQIGYAPGSQFMYNLFSTAGNVEAGKKLGLINDKNQDKLWNRLIYPINDERGKISGFASRRLDDNADFAKWMNPAENDLYRKDRILYGLHMAKSAIVKQNRAWIVEGYNDVIAWHKSGIENTVAPCGTALTDKQIALLKKLTTKITLCMDGDEAGRKSVSKNIPILIAHGFSVTVCQLPDDPNYVDDPNLSEEENKKRKALDPDDYSRKFPVEEGENFEKSLQPYLIDGFSAMVLEKMHGDELDRINGIREIIKTINKVPDASLQHVYTEKLAKESKMKAALIKNMMKEAQGETIRISNLGHKEYELPAGVTTPPEKLLPYIKAYQMFQSDDRIFIQTNFDAPPYYFKAVSNFSMDIVQHMNDEKMPMKLIRIKNIHGLEKIYDTPADQLNTPQRFTDMLSHHGNFQWDGDAKDLKKLTSFLFDQMGVGRKVDVLGWNPEGFYCWNNTVTIPGEKNIDIDKNGIFHYDGHTYYVPSANEIYRNNATKFQTQKRIVLKPAPVSMEEYLAQFVKVHREFGMIGILFSFAAVHVDLIYETVGSFPIFFLYGPPSTGKDQVFAAMKAMFGISAADSINLENNQSTGKAKIRKFAELANMLVHLSEYTNHNKENVGLMKGLWDRSGYTRGTMDSMYTTETVPIRSSAIMTGNETPTDEAVLTRLVFGEMQKNQFSDQEKAEFKKLNELTAMGTTDFIQRVLWERPAFKEKFPDRFNMYKTMLGKRESFQGVADRLPTNYAVLGATFDILRDTIVFPFGFNDMLEVFDKFAANTKRKLESYSVIARFWDVVIAVMRGNKDNQIKVGRDMRLEGNTLAFNYTNLYNRIQTEWYPRNNESAPAKMTLLDKIKKDDSFVDTVASYRMGEGSNAPKTSVIRVNIDKLDCRNDLVYAIEWQKNEQMGMDDLYGTPATPNIFSDEEAKSAEDGGTLGF